MDVALSSLFSLYQFSTGRLLFALQGVDRAVREHDDDLGDLGEHVAKAIRHSRTTRQLEAQFAASQNTPRTNPKAAAIDVKVDRALVALRDAAQAHVTAADDDAEVAARASKLLLAIFPRGVQAVTQATFVEELSLVDGILAEIKANHADTVKHLGLSLFVTRLAKLNDEYRVAQQAPAAAGTDFSAVRASRQRGQELLLEVTAMVLGQYPLQSAAHVAARQALLGPILSQNEAIGVYLRGRRTPDDVNPETGEPVPTVTPAPVAEEPQPSND
jgi:hypothetical protein